MQENLTGAYQQHLKKIKELDEAHVNNQQKKEQTLALLQQKIQHSQFELIKQDLFESIAVLSVIGDEQLYQNIPTAQNLVALARCFVAHPAILAKLIYAERVLAPNEKIELVKGGPSPF